LIKMHRRKKHKDLTASKSTRAKAGAGRESVKSIRRNSANHLTYPGSFKTVIWVAAVLVAINLFIYAPIRHYGFLSYDDPPYVSENAQVIRGLTGQGVLWAFTTGHASNWHPMTWLSHMLDVQMYGMNAGRHHSPLLLHIANALLLFGYFIVQRGVAPERHGCRLLPFTRPCGIGGVDRGTQGYSKHYSGC
jgi:hypothetical protein